MYIGIDIGGTKTLVASLDNDGVITEHHQFPTPADYGSFLRELAVVVAKFTTKKFIGAGVGVPGRVDRAHGIGIAFGNLPWHAVPIQADVAKITNCPVVIENDANLGGLSEAMLLKQYDRVLYVTISTGIGTGIIYKQRIEPSFADSEGGKMLVEYRGTFATWEHVVSGRALFNRYGKRVSEITDDTIWHRIAHELALGFTNLIAIVQPEVIVLGGSVSAAFRRFHKHLDDELANYQTPLTPVPMIREAQRPHQAVVYGCYDLAKATYGKHH